MQYYDGSNPRQEAEWPETDGIDPDLIDQELQRILKSRHFRHSKRASQFLSFVVQQKLKGNQELVKERLIGVELFGRKTDYATGDDPIVRVQGGEVRRRLELYQNDFDPERSISIELPLGSYVPLFRTLNPGSATSEAWSQHELKSHADSAAEVEAALTAAEAETSLLDLPAILPGTDLGANYEILPPRRSRFRPRALLLGICLVLLATALGVAYWYLYAPSAWMRAFWGPAFNSKRPVLICMAKPVLYKPHSRLFDRYIASHPGSFSSAVDRYNQALPLDPNETIHWGDLYSVGSGPAVGGVRAGMNISALFGRKNVPFGVRFGEETTFTDLRETASVIVGAMNSRWILQMSPELHFVMTEVDGRLWIKEAGPNGRKWSDHGIPNGWRDYGLITRQLNSPTGQFLVKLEGIMDSGTQACSEVVTDPDNLRSILSAVPKGWENKNIQMVVTTDITDGKAGPPKLLAFYAW